MAIANINNQIVDVNIIPGFVPPVLHLSQYDNGKGRPIKFVLYDGTYDFSIPSDVTYITFEGTKPDGHGFIFSCGWSTGTNTVTLSNYTEQMTSVAGKMTCQLVLKNASGGQVGSLSVLVVVQPSGVGADTDLTPSKIGYIVEKYILDKKVNSPLTDPYGTSGQILRTLGDGDTEWVDIGLPTDEQTAQAVSDWLDDHPEATTTVQDGSITESKFSDALKLKTIKNYGTPEMYGAEGDGITDDSDAIQSALDNYKIVVFDKNKTYKVANPISLNDGNCLILNGCGLLADITEGDLFTFVKTEDNAGRDVIIDGGRCTISGECKNAFRLIGDSDFTASPNNYARMVVIDSVSAISGNSIECFCRMDVAVRDVWITRCTMYCKNGIISTGKSVEIMLSKNIINTSSANNNAIKISSDQGSAYYSEGWTIDNSTIDTGKTEISDIYVCNINNCYIGSPVYFHAPTETTHTREIQVSGCTIREVINFDSPSGVTNSFNAVLVGNIYCRNVILDTCASVSILDSKFESSGGSGSAVSMARNVHNIMVCNADIDATYNNGIMVLDNVVGLSNVCVKDIWYRGTGAALYSGKPIYSNNVVGGLNPFIRNYIMHGITSGSYDVNDNLIQSSVKLGKGQKGYIFIVLSMTGASDNTQRLEITAPSHMIIPSSSELGLTSESWNAKYIYVTGCKAASIIIPFYCDDNVDGTLTLKNAAGNTITVGSHAYYSIYKQ